MTSSERPTIKHIYQNFILDSTNWDGFQVRDGDIVVATSYKTGTTWMQGICAALVFQASEPPAAQDDLSPWLDARFAPAEETLALLEGLTHRRYIKTHLPLDGLPFSSRIKYIFVGRNGLDVFMSLWHHWNNMRPESIDEINATPGRVGNPLPLPPPNMLTAFDAWLDRGGFPWEHDGYLFWSHLAHAQSWWDYRHLENILFVHFNDLLADLDGEMRRVSAYLDIPVNETLWPTLVQSATFNAMKANAEKMAPASTIGLWKDTSNFFHRGTNRRWEGALTDEQIARYRRLAAERLEPQLARWLEYGRRVAGDPGRPS
jgi:aryl sulfotransferase